MIAPGKEYKVLATNNVDGKRSPRWLYQEARSSFAAGLTFIA